MDSSQKIVADVHWVGVKDRDLKIFDDLFPTHNGTTYNAYLVCGKNKTVLIDTVKEPFSAEFFSKVGEHLALEKVDAVIINHTEPDHSGALNALLDKNPELVVYCSRPADNFLRQLLNRDFTSCVIEEGGELDLGGKTLRFYLAPSLHWPDTIFTYLVEDDLLFSCDAFGAHYCSSKLFDDEIADFSADFYFYFDCIMRPFKDKVREALAKISDLPIRMICPSHGPIRRSTHQDALNSYHRWSAAPPIANRPKALLAILSSHGNTRKMAAVVRTELEARGIEVNEFALSAMRDDDYRNALEEADVLVIGTPTIQRDAPPQVWHALTLISSVNPKVKRAAVFGSYGWSGEATKMIEERLRGLKYTLATDGLSFRFTPTAANLEECRQFASRIAAAVLKD